MSVAQQSFAEAIEHRLRKRWPEATVAYVGGGWFKLRCYPMNPAGKARRSELLDKARKIEEVEA
jgi:hypothetical protein